MRPPDLGGTEGTQPGLGETELGIALAGELASSLDPRDVVNRLVRRAVEAVHADRATLSSIEGEEIVIEATYSTTASLDWAGHRYAMNYIRRQPLVNEAMTSRRPVLGGQLNVDSAAPELQPGLREMAHTAVLPLILGNEVVALLVLSRARGPEFTIGDLSRLQELGNVAMLALRNARLYSDLESASNTLSDRVRELSLLLETARTLSASLDAQVIHREVTRSAAQLVTRGGFRERRATMFVVDGDTATALTDFDETGHSVVDQSFSISDHPGIAAAIAENRATSCEMTEVTGQVGETARELGIRSGAYAPIHVGDALVGILGVACRDEGGFGGNDLTVLAGIAHLAGLALGNAEKLQLERSRSLALAEHAERMQELEKVKSHFLNLASHELRGPSTVLRGYLTMISEGTMGEVSPQLATALPVLLSKVEQMHMLIEQMLDAARLEESRLELSPQRVDVRQLVERAVTQMGPLWGSTDRIELQLPEQPAPVDVDAERALTIITNLLENALKYSAEDTSIACAVQCDAEHAIVAITDNGMGIAEADMPRLFTRFGRIVTTDNSHIPGSGLGLYLSREIARLMGGDVRARSRLGVGSTFELLLPLAKN